MGEATRNRRRPQAPGKSRRIAAFVCMIGLSACSGPSFSDADIPEISLAGLSFGDIDADQQDVTVQLRLKNLNDFDVPIDRLTFDLDVEGAPFADGESDENVLLPASTELIVPIQLSMASDQLTERVSALGTGKQLDYRLTGSTVVDALFNAPIISFDREGKLALPELPGLK